MAVKSKVKAKEHENLTETNIKKVIELLECEKPVSKKEACELLNISYNTTRLAKIIENFKQDQEESKRRKAANRGKPAAAHEVQSIIESYLDGDSVAEIAKRIYRSSAFVKEVIENIGVPQKSVNADYWKPGLVPDQCLREEFIVGEVVWNTKRNAMCIIREEQKASDPTNKYYQTYVLEPIENTEGHRMEGYGGFYDGAYAYDLAALDHLKKHGVDVSRPYRPYFGKWLEGN